MIGTRYRRRWIVPIAFLYCAMTSSAKPIWLAPRTDRLQDSSNSKNQRMEQDILHLINQDRLQKGLTPLQFNPVEAAVAAQHSADMASGKSAFGHDGVQARMNAIQKQLGPLSGFGENVAFGQSSAKDVVDEWLHSKIHKQNIEGDFTLTGIGLAKDPHGRMYFTEVFTR
jgi:uncharacterized protein YkwD